MKRCLILILVLIILSGCSSVVNTEPTVTDVSGITNIKDQTFQLTENVEIPDKFNMVATKDSVPEFFSVLINDIEIVSATNAEYEQKNCYNVTPASVSEHTGVKIFKFADTCETFVFIDNEIYYLCASFGGYGFINATPWDYDKDGNFDLLVTASWGSGIHRSEISVFNTKTKENIIIYNNLFSYVNPRSDLFITDDFHVYSCTVDGHNFVGLSITPYDFIGTVSNIDGVPVFISSKKNLPSFSYNNTLEIYKDEPGLKLSGFVNTEKTVITTIDQVIELAEKECTVEYDTTKVKFDSVNKIFCVSFYKTGFLGGDQNIYIDEDGITQLIYYGE